MTLDHLIQIGGYVIWFIFGVVIGRMYEIKKRNKEANKMGYLVKSWDHPMCTNFICGIAVLSTGLILLFGVIVAMALTGLLGFGLLIFSFNLEHRRPIRWMKL